MTLRHHTFHSRSERLQVISSPTASALCYGFTAQTTYAASQLLLGAGTHVPCYFSISFFDYDYNEHL